MTEYNTNTSPLTQTTADETLTSLPLGEALEIIDDALSFGFQFIVSNHAICWYETA